MLNFHLSIFFLSIKLKLLKKDSIFFRIIDFQIMDFRILSMFLLKNKKILSLYLFNYKKNFKLKKGKNER